MGSGAGQGAEAAAADAALTRNAAAAVLVFVTAARGAGAGQPEHATDAVTVGKQLKPVLLLPALPADGAATRRLVGIMLQGA